MCGSPSAPPHTVRWLSILLGQFGNLAGNVIKGSGDIRIGVGIAVALSRIFALNLEDDVKGHR